MPVVKIRNLKNKKVGEIELSEKVFGGDVNRDLLHEIVQAHRAKTRSGTAATKERNAVAGGGRKPHRQKGSGRARQGSDRAPNHVGGGTVFGPRPRSYGYKPTKQARRGAMCSALSLFFKEDRLIVVDDFELPEIKTRGLVDVLDKLGAASAMIVDAPENETLRRSAGNLASHRFLPPDGLNVFDLLKHEQLVITKRAVIEVQNRLESPVRPRRAGR